MPSIPIGDDARNEMLAAHRAGEMYAEVKKAGQQGAHDLSDPHSLKAHLISGHDWDEGDFWRNSHDERHPQLGGAGMDDRQLTHHELRKVHDHHDHVVYRGDFPGAVTLGHSHFHE